MKGKRTPTEFEQQAAERQARRTEAMQRQHELELFHVDVNGIGTMPADYEGNTHVVSVVSHDGMLLRITYDASMRGFVVHAEMESTHVSASAMLIAPRSSNSVCIRARKTHHEGTP